MGGLEFSGAQALGGAGVFVSTDTEDFERARGAQALGPLAGAPKSLRLRPGLTETLVIMKIE